jgi:hypothetical protein
LTAFGCFFFFTSVAGLSPTKSSDALWVGSGGCGGDDEWCDVVGESVGGGGGSGGLDGSNSGQAMAGDEGGSGCSGVDEAGGDDGRSGPAPGDRSVAPALALAINEEGEGMGRE